MADQVVRTTQTTWAAEVARAEAAYNMDAATPAGVVALEGKKQPAGYTFSNGRSFAAPVLPKP
jgi:hypothetical protein